MVFDVHGQPLLARNEARSFRHRPALQHAVEFQAEVIMQPPRRVFLDDIGIAGLPHALAAGRFRRLREVPLRPIGIQRLVHRRNLNHL
jgi:hypothetical protein